MKLIVVFLLTLCLESRATVYAQKISLHENNVSLGVIFKKIKRQSPYTFVFTDDLMRKTDKVTVDLNNVTLDEALSVCLANQPLEYTVFNKIVVIKDKSETRVTATRPAPAPVTVKGKVLDQDGGPLPGAVVNEKGTSNSVAADVNGNFSIRISNPGAVLVFSFVGFDKQEIPANDGSEMVVKLTQAKKSLEEIVVVGYGTQKKATLTGSITTVNAKSFEDKGTVTNPLKALQGQVPGVIITRQSSAPGQEGWNLQIRGATSTNSTSPLIVIDGVAASDNNALNSLNPNDIESMSFLKDASVAIYGARAAGGVILITSKKGALGKTVVTYDGSFSKKVIGLQAEQMSLVEYANGLIEARTNDGYSVTANDILLRLANMMLKYHGQVISATNYPAGQLFPDGSPIPAGNPIGFGDVIDYPFLEGNYQDQLFKNGSSNQQNFGISGGSEKSTYRLSLGFTRDGGLLRYGDNASTRYNFRFINEYRFSDRVRLQSSITMDKNNTVQPSQIGTIFGFGFQPGFPDFARNGQNYAWGGNVSPEGLSRDGGSANSYTTRWYLNETLNWNITDHLTFTTVLGYDPTTITGNTQFKSIQWYDYSGTVPGIQNPTPANSSYAESSATDNYYNANAYLNYKNTFNKSHNVSLTLGGQYERDEYSVFSATTTNQSLNDLPGLNLGIGDATTRSNTGGKNHYAIGSYFGRFNYDFRNKYLFEAQGRYDGSSKFTESNRWKAFYGFSAGWRITQEDFMKKQRIFDDLKLRFSYGTSGNQSGIGLYDYIQLLNLGYATSVTSNNPFLGTGQVVTLSPTSNLVSLNRTWEKVEKYNLALDFALLNSRLTGTGEVFINNNVNMLVPIVYPAVLGATAPFQNAGYLRTKGSELSLNWADKIGKLNYHIGGNITYNTNKVLSYQGASLIALGINGVIEGQPINSVYGLQYDGRIQDQAQLTAYLAKYSVGNTISLPTTLRVGGNMYKDVNGDGKLTNADYVNLGTEDPRVSYSFNLGLNYKGFDLNAVFQGVGQRTIFRNTQSRVPFGAWFWSQQNFSVGKTWNPSNTNAYYPALSTDGSINGYNYQASTFSVENGQYLRLKNLVLGYTLPDKLIKRTKFVSRMRIYLSGNDLWEITKIHDGWDPEAPSNVQGNVGEYPFYRLISAGFNLTF